MDPPRRRHRSDSPGAERRRLPLADALLGAGHRPRGGPHPPAGRPAPAARRLHRRAGGVRCHARRLPAVRRAQRTDGRLAAGRARQRGDARIEHGRGPSARPLHAARPADGDARDDRRRRLGHRHDGRRPRRRRPARGVHAVPARARRRAAHAAADRRVRRWRRDRLRPDPGRVRRAARLAPDGADRARCRTDRSPRPRPRWGASGPDGRRWDRGALRHRLRRPAGRCGNCPSR